MAGPVRLKDPTVKRGFTDPTKLRQANTLAQKLIPVADSIRDLHTRFGMRNYKVRVVRVRWSEGVRGRGVPVVEDSTDIMPTPLVQDLSTMTEILSPIGLDETGVIQVSEISGSYTDNQLRLLEDDGQEPSPDLEIFYEIEYPQPVRGTREDTIKRRFFIRGAPFYNAQAFQWIIRLEKSNEDRALNGDPR